MKKVVKTTYACGICLHEFETPQSALGCEKRGIALPEFKCFEVAELTGLISGKGEATTVSGFKVEIKNGTRVVIQDNAKEDWPDSHLLPKEYDVWVYTPGQTVRPVFRGLLSGVGRELLKKVHVRRNGRCQFCGNTILVSSYKPSYSYLGLGDNLPFLKVEVQRCPRCYIEFFTTAQSRRVDALVRQKCLWPIANTRKLIKECAFE